MELEENFNAVTLSQNQPVSWLVFGVWTEAILALKRNLELDDFMHQLGKTQPPIPDLGLDKPYLPSRSSALLEEQELFRRFPEWLPLLDFISSRETATWLGMDDDGNIDPKRVEHLEKFCNVKVKHLPDCEDGPVAWVDTGNYYLL
ncbi:hypothetical protein D3C71_76920 [compost metagenome]